MAIDTQDRTPVASATINVEGVDAKIAALVGVTPDQILVNYMKVNPISKNVYLSVARGQGPSATAMIIRVDPSGNITNVPLDNAMGTPWSAWWICRNRNRKAGKRDHRAC